MKQTVVLIITLFLLSSCVPLDQGKSSVSNQSYPPLVLADHNYSKSIKSVQLYRNDEGFRDQTSPSVTHLRQNNLLLEFDDLKVDADIYRVKIINCTASWKKSSLSNLEFLYDFNEFNINKFEFSVDTEVPYVHYQFQIPKIKLAGNYVVVVYRGDNVQDLVLSKRFMVYENKVSITPANLISGFTNISRLNQQIEFNIEYKDYKLVNPLQSVTVHIRQNKRWDNMISGIKPNFIREDVKQIEYRFFNNGKNFLSGNEFRFFDLRSLRYPGQNIQKVEDEMGKQRVYIMPDKPRAHLAYAQYNDNNGCYYIDSRDGGDPKFSAEYNNVKFSLISNKIEQKGDIYVFGALTDWQLNEYNKMSFNQENGRYEADIMLKQGFYDYTYYFKSDSTDYNYVEGNYFDTENEYEIFVYYRPFNSRTDLLIGYLRLQKNERSN